MSYHIRFSRLTDYPQLVEMENQLWNEKNTPHVATYADADIYMEQFPIGSHLVAVTEDDKEVLGFLGFHPPTGIPAHQKTWILDIGVRESVQGQGVGTSLLTALKALATDRGIHKLVLRVLSTNPQAVAFYRKNGFLEEGILKEEFCINGKYVDDILMAYFIEKDQSKDI